MYLNDVLKMEIHEFFDYIKTIRYGYCDSAGELHFIDDPDFEVGDYTFSSPEQVVENNCGWCWDVAGLIAGYCAGNGLVQRTYFMEYFSPELHQTHTQVVLQYDGAWHAAPDNSSPETFGETGFSSAADCIENFFESFVAYLKHVLQEKYDPACLLLNEHSGPIPAGVSDEEYLQLMRQQVSAAISPAPNP